MDVAFSHAGGTDFQKPRLFSQLIQSAAAAVSHPGLQAADELKNIGLEGAPVGYPTDDSFRYQLIIFGLFALVVSILAALFHGFDRSHAAIHFIAAALEKNHLTRALLRSGEKSADHDAVGAGTDRLGQVA